MTTNTVPFWYDGNAEFLQQVTHIKSDDPHSLTIDLSILVDLSVNANYYTSIDPSAASYNTLTFGEVALVGRPINGIEHYGWGDGNEELLELCILDPLPTEAWDESKGKADSDYTGPLRLNINGLLSNDTYINYIETGQLTYAADGMATVRRR